MLLPNKMLMNIINHPVVVMIHDSNFYLVSYFLILRFTHMLIPYMLKIYANSPPQNINKPTHSRPGF